MAQKKWSVAERQRVVSAVAESVMPRSDVIGLVLEHAYARAAAMAAHRLVGYFMDSHQWSDGDAVVIPGDAALAAAARDLAGRADERAGRLERQLIEAQPKRSEVPFVPDGEIGGVPIKGDYLIRIGDRVVGSTIARCANPTRP